MYFSDQDVQDYLDGLMPQDKEEQFELEIGKNRALRETLDQYRHLYASLDKNNIQLSENFTQDVVKNTNLAVFGAIHFNLWYVFIGLFITIIAINVSFYYVDTQKLVNDVISSPQPEIINNQSILHNIIDSLISIQISTPIPILAIIILVILFSLDRWFMHRRQRHISFSGHHSGNHRY